MEETKSITLSGSAASEYMGTGNSMPLKRGGGRRKTQKIRMEGGEESEGVVFKPELYPTPPVISVNVPPTPSLASSASSATATPPASSTEGGASTHKSIKVELKKRGSAKRVHLQPKKAAGPVVSKKQGLSAGTTRKVRRFTLGVSSLQKRMTRAKKVQKKVDDMPLDKLKALLVQKKLIKATSKAPESILRQIAADAQIVAGKAL